MTGLARALLDSLDEDALDLLAERLAPLLARRLTPCKPIDVAEAMLTCSQAAQQAGTHVETIRRAVRSLNAGRAGRSPRIAPADLDRWMHRAKRDPQEPRSRAPRPTTKRRTLADALSSIERVDGTGVR
jgi:excisionase family DNA binding protein